MMMLKRLSFASIMLPSFRQQSLVERTIRVDHAGEYAAYQIYAGQLRALEGRPIISLLKRMQEQEKEHLREMERLCAKHIVEPSVMIPYYRVLTYLLGYTTAMLGNKSAMACTVAVEELIADHYNDQIKKLIDDDPAAHADLLQVLSKLRDQELEHHDTAVEHHGLEAPFYKGMRWAIQSGCKAAIWISERI